MFRKIKKRIRKRGMLMFEAVLMLATLTAVTFGMVTIMTGSFSNLAAAKDAGEAQQMGDLVVSLVKQKDYDKMDELISYAPASKPTSMDNFVGDSDLKGKYSFSVEQIGDEIDAGSLDSTDDSDSTDDEGAKVKIMKVAIHPQDNKNVELYSTQVPVMSDSQGNSGGEAVGTIIPRLTANFTSTSEAGKYLYCDGSTFDTSKYPKLYNILGTNILPDLCNRFLEGAEVGGSVIEAALPNITGRVGWWNDSNGTLQSGALILSNSRFGRGQETGSGGIEFVIGFDASRSSSIYKNNINTVQPPAVTVRYYIRAK